MKLNVCMITYNHEKFVVQAIEGVLMQRTDFDFNLVIGEDCSKDNTREICKSYADKFPDKIKLIISDSNVGMQKNFWRTYQACEAKFIAFCEGDDFWTDPYKLQKQVDFLVENPEYSCCFHNVMLKTERDGINEETIMHKGLTSTSFGTEDVLGPWFIASPSVVFVNYPDFELPDWFHNCLYGDLPFMLLLSLRGKFKYLDELMGVYRLHDTGMSVQHKNYDKIMLMVYIYASFDIHTRYRFHDTIRKSVQYEVDRHSLTQVPVQQLNGIGSIVKHYLVKLKNLVLTH